MVLLKFSPWPSKFLAVVVSRSLSAPSLLAPFGPSATVRSSMLCVDLVELQRGRGLVGVEHRAVGQLRAAVVHGGQLDEAVAHDGRRDDHGLGVGGDVDLGVVVHLDRDGVAGRLDLLDLADGYAEHADLGALVERDGAREATR